MRKLLAGIVKLTGRLAAAAAGFALLITGVVLCFTIIGLIIGIPFVILGVVPMMRGLF